MNYTGGGQGGGSPGVMGARSLREAGGEGAEGGISKGGGSREKWGKFRNIGTIFHNRKSTQGQKLLRRGAGTGGAGGRKFRPPCPPPPYYTDSSRLYMGAVEWRKKCLLRLNARGPPM